MTHIGDLVRRLREAAGLTRHQLGEQTHLAASTIRNLETARHLPTLPILHKLLKHPAMAPLPALAKAAGLTAGLGEALLLAGADEEIDSMAQALRALRETAASQAETLDRIWRLCCLLLGGLLTEERFMQLQRLIGKNPEMK